NVSPDVYVERLNSCLDYLRRNFSGHALIYRPHPNETNEADRLKLNGFRIEEDREAAELYFLRNYQTITAVFSVSSTVSRTALNNGINGYAMYPVFPFTTQQLEFFYHNLLQETWCKPALLSRGSHHFYSRRRNSTNASRDGLFPFFF